MVESAVANYQGWRVVLPYEILWKGVDDLPLPRHEVAVAQLLPVPQPPAKYILRAEGFIDSGLIVSEPHKFLTLGTGLQLLGKLCDNQLEVCVAN